MRALREGTDGASPRSGPEKVALAPRPRTAVRGGGTSRYRRQKRPRPGEIQVVPRLYNRPESEGLRAFFMEVTV